MISVDTILKNATILTMDEEFKTYLSGAIAILGENIVAINDTLFIENNFNAKEVIDCGGKILMPGLINAHTHVPMTLLRGLSDDLRLDVWLLGYMMPVEREYVTPEFVRLGTKIACTEMIQAGITCFADMYYFEDEVAEATAEIGMRAVCGESVLKFPTPDAHSYEESLDYSRSFIKKWKGHPLIVPAIAPHAPYTCTEDILQKSKDLAIEFDVPLHIHLAETALEVENCRSEFGMPVIPYVKKQNLFDAKVIAAHCVHIDPGEIRTLKSSNAGVAHNPSSNLKLASGIAPIRQLMELGVNVGIGTDGPASNNDLDMFEEIRLTTFLAKGVSGDPTTLPAKTTLAMATRIGAKALHIGDITGSLEPGKRADLITINLDTVHNSPSFRHLPDAPYSQVVYAAKATDVKDVMVNGKWLMKDRVLQTIKEKELLIQAQDYALKIDQFLSQRESSVVSKLIAIGGAHEEESFEVQVKVPIQNAQELITKVINSGLEIKRTRHYREYDTYFFFEDQDQGRLRYREDHLISDRGEITNVRSRLTLIGVKSERHFQGKVLLSRSRYFAPATQSLRFYKEYFNPVRMLEIDKDRKRFLIDYKNTEFFINIDQFKEPLIGTFLEIKSRTWSKDDAEIKSRLAIELLDFLGIQGVKPITEDYIELVKRID
ncbi:MAG: amidohydrolase family protein [Anaerolineaceae bacterium]|nr:MAG: amidohydrolase [Chloroflexi bacterium HGW-Chloroflexi-8]